LGHRVGDVKTNKRWVERAQGPVPGEIEKKGELKGECSESAGLNDSSGRQSRGLRAFSDVSQIAVQ
jgi:hypothetical protein